MDVEAELSVDARPGVSGDGYCTTTDALQETTALNTFMNMSSLDNVRGAADGDGDAHDNGGRGTGGGVGVGESSITFAPDVGAGVGVDGVRAGVPSLTMDMGVSSMSVLGTGGLLDESWVQQQGMPTHTHPLPHSVASNGYRSDESDDEWTNNPNDPVIGSLAESRILEAALSTTTANTIVQKYLPEGEASLLGHPPVRGPGAVSRENDDDVLLDGDAITRHLGKPDQRQVHTLGLRSAYERYSVAGEPSYTFSQVYVIFRPNCFDLVLIPNFPIILLTSPPHPTPHTPHTHAFYDIQPAEGDHCAPPRGVQCIDFLFYSFELLSPRRIGTIPSLSSLLDSGDDPREGVLCADPVWAVPPRRLEKLFVAARLGEAGSHGDVHAPAHHKKSAGMANLPKTISQSDVNRVKGKISRFLQCISFYTHTHTHTHTHAHP
jgi:hypothetical protein